MFSNLDIVQWLITENGKSESKIRNQQVNIIEMTQTSRCFYKYIDRMNLKTDILDHVCLYMCKKVVLCDRGAVKRE